MAKKLNNVERKEWLRFKKQGCTPLHRCKINEFVVHIANTKEHELAKFDIYWEHREQGCNLLTECDLISTNERCDVYCLTCMERYEIETSVNRALRFKDKPINVIPIGWDFNHKKWKEG